VADYSAFTGSEIPGLPIQRSSMRLDASGHISQTVEVSRQPGLDAQQATKPRLLTPEVYSALLPRVPLAIPCGIAQAVFFMARAHLSYW
jgi:hypothetical protein